VLQGAEPPFGHTLAGLSQASVAAPDLNRRPPGHVVRRSDVHPAVSQDGPSLFQVMDGPSATMANRLAGNLGLVFPLVPPEPVLLKRKLFVLIFCVMVVWLANEVSFFHIGASLGRSGITLIGRLYPLTRLTS
jgi:hypothetical protein